jgi:hypothetical protein
MYILPKTPKIKNHIGGVMVSVLAAKIVSFLGSDGGRSLFGIYTLLIKWNNYFMI